LKARKKGEGGDKAKEEESGGKGWPHEKGVYNSISDDHLQERVGGTIESRGRGLAPDEESMPSCQKKVLIENGVPEQLKGMNRGKDGGKWAGKRIQF